ncbi:hypothetical protein [Marinoscillum sp. MHG1-6]|uniref:hypothetical protein n=1 Tax=Marinoscillum sp. MHG1-6 TaxID=2959627 RepID=UPI00215803A9|nr:hypothetical protein [Marinoscillum sp. MHG1-6]
MKYILVYSYRTNDYQLDLVNKIDNAEDVEVLYEFELSEMKIMTNVLKNLRLQRNIRMSEKVRELIAA